MEKNNHNSSVAEKVICLFKWHFFVVANATAGVGPMTSKTTCSLTRKSNKRNASSKEINIEGNEIFSLNSRQQSLPMDTVNETTLQITTKIQEKRISVVHAQGLCDNIPSTNFIASPSKHLDCMSYRTQQTVNSGMYISAFAINASGSGRNG